MKAFREWLFKLFARSVVLFTPAYSVAVAIGAEPSFDLVARIVNGCIIGAVVWRISED